MADIVKRLRMEAGMEAAQCDLSPCDCQCPNLIEAADEIERLRAAGDALAADYEIRLQPLPDPQFEILKTWEEARRGWSNEANLYDAENALYEEARRG